VWEEGERDPDETSAPARPWRVITYVDGVSVDKIDGPARAHAAGAMAARFHGAVVDLSHDYKHVRRGAHDTRQHLVKLAMALASNRAHRLFEAVEPLARSILDAGPLLPPLLVEQPMRHCHGDLKISNVLFDRADTGRAVCLVDLDTLQRLPWCLEMGDAMRSWCNPHGEDVVDATVDASLFQAACDGYFGAAGGPSLTPAERGALVDGTRTIALELAARFCADALHESYFGFDATKFATRGEHNLLRARGQWSLAQDIKARRSELVAFTS
jgi:Ser/Thr protein kinase RdoA (MazF antagonist)